MPQNTWLAIVTCSLTLRNVKFQYHRRIMTFVHTVLLNFQITVDNQIFKISEKSSENPKSILGSDYVIGLLFVLKEARLSTKSFSNQARDT